MTEEHFDVERQEEAAPLLGPDKPEKRQPERVSSDLWSKDFLKTGRSGVETPNLDLPNSRQSASTQQLRSRPSVELSLGAEIKNFLSKALNLSLDVQKKDLIRIFNVHKYTLETIGENDVDLFKKEMDRFGISLKDQLYILDLLRQSYPNNERIQQAEIQLYRAIAIAATPLPSLWERLLMFIGFYPNNQTNAQHQADNAIEMAKIYMTKGTVAEGGATVVEVGKNSRVIGYEGDIHAFKVHLPITMAQAVDRQLLLQNTSAYRNKGLPEIQAEAEADFIGKRNQQGHLTQFNQSQEEQEGKAYPAQTQLSVNQEGVKSPENRIQLR